MIIESFGSNLASVPATLATSPVRQPPQPSGPSTATTPAADSIFSPLNPNSPFAPEPSRAPLDAVLAPKVTVAQQADKDLKTAIDTHAPQHEIAQKQRVSDQRWADVKVDVKDRMNKAGAQGKDKLATDLKSAEPDATFGKLVDQAKTERPDIPIASAGNNEADAAARRVAGAYAGGGDAAAAKQLRIEVEAAQDPAQRAAILKSAMPVADQVAKDVGLNSGRGAQDWNKDGYEAGGAYSTDTGNVNPIDSRPEYDDTLTDLNRSVDLAADPKAAFQIANDILQVMPAATASDAAASPLGLLGDDLSPDTRNGNSLLARSLTQVLVEPEFKGPQGTTLSQPLAQRDAAALKLTPDMAPAVVVNDWTDSRGVHHDGTVWHEVSRNPDLFLTPQQRTAIDADTRGSSAKAINERKTAIAVQNLRGKYPDRNLDRVQENDQFGVDPSANSPAGTGSSPAPQSPAVTQAVSDATAGHPGDAMFTQGLNALMALPAWNHLTDDQKSAAIKGYAQASTEITNAGLPLTPQREHNLQRLLTSPAFLQADEQARNPMVYLYAHKADYREQVDKLLADSGTSDAQKTQALATATQQAAKDEKLPPPG
jgi:hypothetical protein